MASGLRAKLNMIGAANPPKPAIPKRETGVKLYSARVTADARLFALTADGLRRIGWCGRAFDIRRALFIDTETTGLSGGAGTIAFLVGIGYIDGGDFAVEQYLMRDYSDEAEMLSRLGERFQSFDTYISFNGKNFDLPLLKSRFAMCRMRELWQDKDQIDLLYPARRTWKLRIGSCRLSRIEEMILGCPRSDDLPGSEVPARYFEFLKSGDDALLTDIIDHNRQDIITLGTLLAHLCCLYDCPQKETRCEDLFSIGRALENQGELAGARELYRIASIPAPAGSIASLRRNPVAERAAWQMYTIARRCKNTEAMRECLEQMALRRQMRDRIYVELAKLYEHRYKNPRRALRYAELAAKYAPPEQMEQIRERRARLLRKIQTQNGGNKHGLFG